jgi:3-keto-L-gulonate-6-phosphate decarboxylase
VTGVETCALPIYGVDVIDSIRGFWQQKFFSPEDPRSGIKNFKLETLGLKELRDLLLKKNSFKKIFQENKNKDNIIAINPYIVADLKCMDRAFTEVEAAKSAGAEAVTCLGLAPVETIDAFIEKCEEIKIDSFLDMLNVEYPFEVLSKLKSLPKVVMLHRGVDEGEENREKEVPYHQIERIKGTYDDILIAIAGGETAREAITGGFNDADIVIVWKLFNENPGKIAELTEEFLEKTK